MFHASGHLPDAACLLVGANMGVVGMCREHLGVALALKVPVFFVITKTDIAPEHVLRNTVQVGRCQNRAILVCFAADLLKNTVQVGRCWGRCWCLGGLECLHAYCELYSLLLIC